jgi:hypothetical protein
MKTLVIHPKDPSTDFLKPIYEGLDEVTLVTGGWNQPQIKEAIQTHDQVILMGHGSPGGLFSVGKFPMGQPYSSFVINSDLVEVLAQKDNTVFIWCHADQFVRHNRLKGFYSGMFVSEVGEAFYCDLPSKAVNQEVVDESNHTFSQLLGNILSGTRDPKVIHEQIKATYGMIAEVNPVAQYNFERLFLS